AREVVTATVVERAAPMVPTDAAGGVVDLRSDSLFGTFARSMVDPEGPSQVLTGPDGAVVQRWTGVMPRRSAAEAMTDRSSRRVRGLKGTARVGPGWAVARRRLQYVFIRLDGIESWSDQAIAERLSRELDQNLADAP
ncbi:MAG: hypothetical protein AAFO29_11580, partial [Actinomycetota bacterium]